MININDFDSSLIKIDKKPYKNVRFCNIGYITIKKIDDYQSINSVNPLYLIVGKADGYIEENSGNQYLAFTSRYGNKKILAKFAKLWDGKKGEYEKDSIKIKFNSDDNLPLNKILKLHMLTVIARSIFEGDDKYPQIFLDECLYEV